MRFRVCGPAGIAWEKAATVLIPSMPAGADGPLAVPVMAEEVALNGPSGDYALTASFDKRRGGHGGLLAISSYRSPITAAPGSTVTLWGVPSQVEILA